MGKAFVTGVMGGSTCTDKQWNIAEKVGRLIAKSGAVLLCGGGKGVMEASAKGAYEAGGLTIGILPGPSSKAANPYISIPIVTNLGDARNPINILSSKLIVAIGGAGGTLSEIALAVKNNRPVIGIDTCSFQFSDGLDSDLFEEFNDFESAQSRLQQFINELMEQDRQ